MIYRFHAVTKGERIVFIEKKAASEQAARKKIRSSKYGRSLRSLMLESVREDDADRAPKLSKLTGRMWLSCDDSDHIYIAGDDLDQGSVVPFASLVNETCVDISQPVASQWAKKLRDFADRLDSMNKL